jgi:LCP family protein required for cell wall assembly
MGSDTREGEGNNIDNLTGGGERSDTTIMFHLSADRKRAYGISIPRDSLVTRPECKTEDGGTIPGGTDVMWNEAFALGGPACTIQQFEQITGVYIDHYVVVDFAGFEDMVDAIDGVEVCIPEDIVDPAHGINIPAGTREIEGRQALNYVRARYTLGDGSDIGRISRQQAFIASMVNKVKSAGVLARPDRLIRFLEAATKSLTLDRGLKNIAKIADLGLQFQDIGLDKIQFLTVPWQYDPREEYRGRVSWLPQADELWRKISNDEPLTRRLTTDAISAAKPPGSDGPSGSPSSGPSKSPEPTEEEAAEAAANGLCA